MKNHKPNLDKKRPRGEFVPLKQFYEFGLENVSIKTIPRLIEMNETQLLDQKLQPNLVFF